MSTTVAPLSFVRRPPMEGVHARHARSIALGWPPAPYGPLSGGCERSRFLPEGPALREQLTQTLPQTMLAALSKDFSLGPAINPQTRRFEIPIKGWHTARA